MSIKPRPYTDKRDLMKLIAATIGGLAYLKYGPAACSPIEASRSNPGGILAYSTPPPENRQITLDNNFITQHPEAAWLAINARNNNPRLWIDTIIINQGQRDKVTSVFLENDLITTGWGKTAYQAGAEKRILVNRCPDSRLDFGGKFPLLVDGKEGVAIPISDLGTQPVIAPDGITEALFPAHKCCGALDGVKKLLAGDKQKLLDHGVTQMTIDNIEQKLIKAGAGTNLLPGETIEEGWARVGAGIQSQINAEIRFKMTGENSVFTTAYGVFDPVTNVFEYKGVVSYDALGEVAQVNIDDFPLLKSYVAYISKSPHPEMEALKTQAPPMAIANASSHPTKNILGAYAGQPGTVFNVEGKVGKTLTVARAGEIVAADGYVMGTLPSADVLFLTADNAQDMKTLTTAFLTKGISEGSVGQFLGRGGTIVTTLVNKETGHFEGVIEILNKDTFGGDIEALKQFVLLRNGAPLPNAIYQSDNIFLRSVMNKALRDRTLEVISEEQYNKILNLVTKLEGFSPIFKFIGVGLNVAGLALTLRDVINFVNNDLLGESLFYTAPAVEGTNIFWNDKTTYVSDPNLNADYGGPVNETLLRGQLDHLSYKEYEDFANTYAGVARAYYKYGPGSTSALHPPIIELSKILPMVDPDPWPNMKPQEVGKLLILQVPDLNGPLPVGVPKITTLITDSVIKPIRCLNGVEYNSSDPSQQMGLHNQITGEFLSADSASQEMLVSAYDPQNPNVTYLFIAEYIPETRRFEFRFTGILSPKNNVVAYDPNSNFKPNETSQSELNDLDRSAIRLGRLAAGIIGLFAGNGKT